VRLTGDGPVWENTIEGTDEGGDGRVAALSGVPAELQRRGPVERAHLEKHGALPDHGGVREGIRYALTQVRRFHRGPGETRGLAVDVAEVLPPGAAWRVTVTADAGDDRLVVRSTVANDVGDVGDVGNVGGGGGPAATLANEGGGRYSHRFPGLEPGLYTVVTRVVGRSDAITSHVLVWDDRDG
jgi:hypothetical protein